MKKTGWKQLVRLIGERNVGGFYHEKDRMETAGTKCGGSIGL